MADDIKKCISGLLHKVILAEVSVDDAMEQISRMNTANDKQVTHALHALQHYRDDADLRATDEQYAELQRNALQRMANAFAHGLPIEDISYW